jgi:hypothetical protein
MPVARLGGRFAADGGAAAHGRALGTLAATVQREAFTLAHIDAFRLSFCVAVGVLLLVACTGASPLGTWAPPADVARAVALFTRPHAMGGPKRAALHSNSRLPSVISGPSV